MLRASSEHNELDLDLDAVRGGADAGDAVEHAAELTAMVDASVESPGELGDARDALVEVMGEAAMVDAAAVIANFEMMTRIADGTGTRHPAGRLAGIEDLRAKLDLDSLASARLE